MSIEQLLGASPYQGYVYAYPHKSAYRPLPEPVALTTLWQDQAKETLFYYLHVPFCEMRCGFCNLFTRANPLHTLVDQYVQALLRQMQVVGESVGRTGCGGFAIGGGTPTYLAAADLECLLDGAARSFGIDAGNVPSSVETSPATATVDRLTLLRTRGFERISIGVQSIHDTEVARSGRRQNAQEVHRALSTIRAAGFPILNVDLIYGIEGQTPRSWDESLRAVLTYRPEEIYLYPLYVRPRTGLAKQARDWDDQRLDLYRRGRDLLLAQGYHQVSMRMFRANGAVQGRRSLYRCQQDGMIGLGCGARSYTRTFHYSHNYAVSGRAVEAIIADFASQTDKQFAQADYGIFLSSDDERRRHVLQSLMQLEGLSRGDYLQRFGAEPERHFGELNQLAEAGLAAMEDDHWRLTEAGVERSDAVGPWLFSAHVRRLMNDFELR